MNKPLRNDPRWQEYSASLRKEQLFVKLPRTKALLVHQALLQVLESLKNAGDETLSESKNHLSKYADWLLNEIQLVSAAYQPSVVYAASLDYAEQDVRHLQQVLHLDTTGILSKFHKCLKAGLQNDPDVDWLIRVGGPRPDFKQVEDSSKPEDLSIFDLKDLFVAS